MSGRVAKFVPKLIPPNRNARDSAPDRLTWIVELMSRYAAEKAIHIRGLDYVSEMVEQDIVEYVPFPEPLKGKYQSYTCADISALRAAGFAGNFTTVEQGVASYVAWLAKS